MIAIGLSRKSDDWAPVPLTQLVHLACRRCGWSPPDPPLLPIQLYSFCLLYLLIQIWSTPGRLLQAIIKYLVEFQAIKDTLDMIVRLMLLPLIQQVVVVEAKLLL